MESRPMDETQPGLVSPLGSFVPGPLLGHGESHLFFTEDARRRPAGPDFKTTFCFSSDAVLSCKRRIKKEEDPPQAAPLYGVPRWGVVSDYMDCWGWWLF